MQLNSPVFAKTNKEFDPKTLYALRWKHQTKTAALCFSLINRIRSNKKFYLRGDMGTLKATNYWFLSKACSIENFHYIVCRNLPCFGQVVLIIYSAITRVFWFTKIPKLITFQLNKLNLNKMVSLITWNTRCARIMKNRQEISFHSNTGGTDGSVITQWYISFLI